jgi:outer membrane receptor for ferrienterochelin and colicins
MKRFFLSALLLAPAFLITAQDSNQVNLAGMSLEELMGVKVVSASGRAQTVSEAPSTIRVITAQQIEERGYERLSDVLRDMEGVDVIHAGGYFPNIVYFRGLYGADNLRTLFLIDGIRENNLVGASDLFGAAYPLHNVERIEIIWGPASAIYGADAFGGVINVITKKGKDLNGLQYEKGIGSFGTTAERASFGMMRQNLDVSFAASMYSTDGPRFTNRDPFYHGSFVDKAWSFNGQVAYTYKRLKSTIGYRIYDTPMSWGLIIPSATKQLNLPSQGNNNSGAIGLLMQDVRNEKPNLYEPVSSTGFLRLDVNASPRLNLTGEFIYRETGVSDRSYVYLSIDSFPLFNADGDTIQLTEVDTAANGDTISVTTLLDTSHIYRLPIFNWSNRLRTDLKANYEINDNQDLLVGVDFSQDNLERGNRPTKQDTNTYVIDGIPLRNIYTSFRPRLSYIRNNFGTYAQYMLRTTLLNKTSFTAGFRYDSNTDFQSPLSPRLGIVINPKEQYTIKLLYGMAFRAPTITEVTSADNAGRPITDPERVQTYELNFIYKPSARWLVQINAFQNNLDNIFVLNSLLGGGFQQKQTKGEAQINGLELHVDFIPINKVSSFANFTYQAGEQNDTSGAEFSIPNLPELKANAGITYSVADYFTVTLIGNWVGERKLPLSNAYGATHGFMLDGYTTGNLVLTTRKFYQNRVSASINIQNAFNTKYLDPGIRTADGGLYSTVMEQPGRWMLFKIKVNL